MTTHEELAPPRVATHPLDLTGKVALITGGNGGIGLGMAEGLAAAGADVCVWGRNAGKNAEALARLEVQGTRVAAMVCDVADEQQVDSAFARTLEAFGRVDTCVVNHALASPPMGFLDRPLDDWRHQLEVNLFGSVHTLRAAARHMVERGEGGSLVLISSNAAVKGQTHQHPYLVSKAALCALARSLAAELARHRIRANAVMPGWVDTPMTEAFLTGEVDAQLDALRTGLRKRIPARRWGMPADFGGLAVYLASDASAYHTGDTLTVDGGWNIT